jgi:hypothetical protein
MKKDVDTTAGGRQAHGTPVQKEGPSGSEGPLADQFLEGRFEDRLDVLRVIATPYGLLTFDDRLRKSGVPLQEELYLPRSVVMIGCLTRSASTGAHSR